mgnify:FL=1
MKKIWLILTILIFLFIFFVSIIPVPEVKAAPSYTDKIVHFFMYFWLTLFIFLSSKKKWLAFFLAGVYGFLIEALQFTLPYRSFSVFDLIVNFVGAFVVVIVSWFYK